MWLVYRTSSIFLRSAYQKTVQVDQEALVTLTQESLEKQTGIQRLEEAATELYKALQASKDRGWCSVYASHVVV